ncbi:hypothetical protein N7494_008131 [Penicillium frequentans]|uniref:Uncharacterized protein n=1 Tax=Penicillium frequentans TaxID=3151616 RepID=A0AAD6CTU2_9EURO|nr:hypothetical protein N7494_008131 [Penicillium glabrum]
MDALITFGAVFTSTGNFSLSSLLTILYGLCLKPYLAPLTVNTTFISQHTEFTPTAAVVNTFLKEQFGEGKSEWSYTYAVKLNRYNGPARNAFQVTLHNSIIPHESPLRELALRVLSAKSVGIHRVDGYTFRILPAHVRGHIDKVDKAFGSSLLLMHLKEFYNGQHQPRGNDWRTPENDWTKYVFEALGAFSDGYNTFSEFLTNEEILNILKLSGLFDNPMMQSLGELLLKMLEACKNKSEKDMKSCKEALKKFDMREKVQLIQWSFKPVLTSGKDFEVILRMIDDDGLPGNEIEQLSKALVQVKACLVPFRGALGIVMNEISEEKNRHRTWGVMSGLAFVPLVVFAWPLAIGAGAALVYCGQRSMEKGKELKELSEMDEASKDIDAMAACTRLYLVLVILKAARFFDLGSTVVREYNSLMAEIFDIDLGDKNFQINHFIKVKGLDICSHLGFLQQGLEEMCQHFGVEPLNSNTDW